MPLYDCTGARDLVEAEGSFPVDIVAVHGITGDAYTTWEDKKTKTLWLRDFLPTELPGARIYSYGYGAEVFLSRATGNMKSFANGLLTDLGHVRKGKEVRLGFIILELS
jgi:hypothetical protein